MRTFTNESDAYAYMRTINRCRRENFVVMVEGPDEDEWTVTDLAEAIAGDFDYRWAA